jgi:hypothetical protein
MPIAGTGIVPPAGPIFNELNATTRRAFCRNLVVQIYFASPSLFYMLGNSQTAAGGLSQVTVDLQGQSMVQAAFTGWGGGFQSPSIIPGIQAGQWNLAFMVIPIPIPFGEDVIQATDRVVSILKARFNDAYAVSRQLMATLLYANNSANPLFPDSLQSAFDNGTNFPTYGGINRNAQGNQAYQGQYINLATAPWLTPFTAGATRKAMASLTMFITTQAGGEAPTYGVMNPGDFATLNTDFIGIEQVFVDPGKSYSMDTPIRSSFPNINVSGIPIFADFFVPKGNIFFSNVKYTTIYVAEDLFFEFSGFKSLIPLNQIGQQGVIVSGYDPISVKSSSGAWCYNLPGAAF